VSKALRAAIIGLGPSTKGKGGAHSFSYCHGWAYAATPGVELVGACSRNPANVKDFLAEFPTCRGFGDYRQMLAELKPDLVSVCAFPPDREEMVTAALRAGARGVWIEKPFALDLAAARRMMAAADQAGARLFVNHQRRYGKPFEWLRDAAQSGRIGKVLGVTVVQPCPNLLDFGSHLVDAALFALGPEPKTTAIFAAVDWQVGAAWLGIRVESQLAGTIHFSDGTRLVIEAGRRVPARSPVLRVDGTDGFAELHLDPPAGAQSIFRARYAGEAGVASPATNEHFHHSEDPALYMKRAALAVRDAIVKGTPTLIDAAEGYRGLEILLGCYAAAEQRRVLVPPFAFENKFEMA